MNRKPNIAMIVGLIMVGALVFCMIFAQWLAPNDPLKIDMNMRFSQASSQFPLGADEYGRCILSRLIHGAYYSLGLSVLIITIIMLLVIPLGTMAAYKGGVFDRLFLWTYDVSMALPPMVLVLAVIGVLGNGVENLILSAVVSYWGWYGRMIRSYTRTEATKGYIIYAQTAGTPFFKIIGTHILPNIAPHLIVLLALGIGDVILMISSFSFLGIGLSADTPEWGAMLNAARSTLTQSPEYAIYPGLCVLFAVCAFNLLGEGLRKQLSPYRKGVDYE